MHKSAPIFYDSTGKRKRIVNIILISATILTLITLLFVTYYFIKLRSINNSASVFESTAITSNNVALLYTDTHANSYSIASDQIQNLDTVIIPKYLLTEKNIATPNHYQNLVEDIDFISENKNLNYNKYFILSSRNYDEQKIARVLNPSVDTQITELINDVQINKLALDLNANHANGIIIDFDLTQIDNPGTQKKYLTWLSLIQKTLAKNNLKLGLKVQPSMFTKYNQEILENIDTLYISLDDYNTDTYSSQLSKIAANQSHFPKNTIFHVPTVSSYRNSSEFSSFNINISYGDIKEYPLGDTITNRTSTPLIYNDENKSYQIVDMISTYNFITNLNMLLNRNPSDMTYAITDPGYEEYTTWKLLAHPLDPAINPYLISNDSYASLVAEEKGEGAIYHIESIQSPGVRELKFDSKNLITASHLTSLEKSPVVVKTGKKPKKVALTFDDGPHPEYTSKVLDILDRYGVKGTFFLVGKNVLAYPEVAREIVERGHQVENHSYDHPVISQLTDASRDSQILATNSIIEEITGQEVHYFRKPFSDSAVLSTEIELNYLKNLNALGLKASEYDIDSKDWLLNSADEVVKKVEAEINNQESDYSQILLHDAHQETQRTLDSLPRIIEYLMNQNIEIATVNELDDLSTNNFATTNSYSALITKNNVLTFFVYSNLLFIIISIAKYAWLITGSFAFHLRVLLLEIKSRLKKQKSSNKKLPEFTILISCYNEEKVIENTVRAIMRNTYKRFELLLVNDGSKDNTAKIIRKLTKKHKNITFLDLPNQGKAGALATAMEYVKTDWIVFCDADTLFAKDALKGFAYRARDTKNLGALAGKIMIGNDINSLTRSQVIEYGIGQLFLKSAQDITRTITVVPGAEGMWHKETLEEAGGFIPDTLAEDADATLRVAALGKRIKYDPSITCRTEAPETMQMLFKQRTRWQLGNMQALTKHRKGMFKKQYGPLGFFGLPLFYIDILAVLFFPLMFGYTIFIILSRILSWEIVLPANVSFATTNMFIFLGILMITIELILSLIVISQEKKTLNSKLQLVYTLPYYLVVYKTFLSYSTIVAFIRAMHGTIQGWGHLKRTASVK